MARVYRSNRVHLFAARSGTCVLYVCIPIDIPELRSGPGPVDLFFVPRQSSRLDLILFMQPGRAASEWKLLKCCFCYDISFIAQAAKPNELFTTSTSIPRTIHYQIYDTLYHTITILEEDLGIGTFLKKWHSGTSHPEVQGSLSDRIIFLDKPWAFDRVLRVFQGLLDEHTGNDAPGLLECYAAYLEHWGPYFDPAVRDGFLELTIRRSDWQETYSSGQTFFLNVGGHLYNWRWRPATSPSSTSTRLRQLFQSPWYTYFSSAAEAPAFLRVSIEWEGVRRYLEEHAFYSALEAVSPCRRVTGADEATMLLCTDSMATKKVHNWRLPKALLDNFKIVARTRRVSIV